MNHKMQPCYKKIQMKNPLCINKKCETGLTGILILLSQNATSRQEGKDRQKNWCTNGGITHVCNTVKNHTVWLQQLYNKSQELMCLIMSVPERKQFLICARTDDKVWLQQELLCPTICHISSLARTKQRNRVWMLNIDY